MVSLMKLWEQTKVGRDFWDNKKDYVDIDEEAMQVLIRGLEIRPDRTEGETFWDDFLSVIGNNGEGASHLLGVRRDIISGWSARIKEGLKKIREENSSDDTKTDMTPTGNG